MHILLENINGDPFRHCAGEDTSGQNLFVREVARHLARRGHRVDISTRATRKEDHLVEVVDKNLRIFRVPAGPSDYLFRDEVVPYLEVYTEKLSCLFREHDLHYHIAHGNYWLSIPVVQAVQGDSFSDRLVYTPHSLGRNKSRSVGIRHPMRDPLESGILKAADGVHVLSKEDETRLRQLYGECRMVRRIPHGIDPAVFHYVPQDEARRRLGWRQDARILLFVGRFEPQKNLPAALRVFEHLIQHTPELDLVIVGGPSATPPTVGDLPADVRAVWEAMTVRDRVRFLGRVPNDQLGWVYAGASALIMPSLYEPFGLVAAECLACGTPIAAYETGGLSETITSGINGSLVPVGDEAGLAAAVQGFLQAPWTDAQTRATKVANSNMRRTWDEVTADFERFYVEISSSVCLL